MFVGVFVKGKRCGRRRGGAKHDEHGHSAVPARAADFGELSRAEAAKRRRSKQASAEEVDAFVQHGLAQGWKPATLQRRLAALKAFFDVRADENSQPDRVNPVDPAQAPRRGNACRAMYRTRACNDYGWRLSSRVTKCGSR